MDLKFSEFLEVASTWRGIMPVSGFGSGVAEASIFSGHDVTSFLG
jgi:hypothetical protein